MMWSRASTKVCGSAAIERGSPARAEGDASARELAQLSHLMVSKAVSRSDETGVVPLRGAGEVAAIGEGVTRVKIGDRIAAAFIRAVWRTDQPDYLTDRLGANLDGMLAEYAVLSEEALVLCRATSPLRRPSPCHAPQ